VRRNPDEAYAKSTDKGWPHFLAETAWATPGEASQEFVAIGGLRLPAWAAGFLGFIAYTRTRLQGDACPGYPPLRSRVNRGVPAANGTKDAGAVFHDAHRRKRPGSVILGETGTNRRVRGVGRTMNFAGGPCKTGIRTGTSRRAVIDIMLCRYAILSQTATVIGLRELFGNKIHRIGDVKWGRKTVSALSKLMRYGSEQNVFHFDGSCERRSGQPCRQRLRVHRRQTGGTGYGIYRGSGELHSCGSGILALWRSTAVTRGRAVGACRSFDSH